MSKIYSGRAEEWVHAFPALIWDLSFMHPPSCMVPMPSQMMPLPHPQHYSLTIPLSPSHAHHPPPLPLPNHHGLPTSHHSKKHRKWVSEWAKTRWFRVHDPEGENGGKNPMVSTAVLGSQHKQLLLSGLQLHAAESVQGATGRRKLLSYVLTLP